MNGRRSRVSFIPRRADGVGVCFDRIGPFFHLWSTFLGDQWSIGAWDAMREGASEFLPEHLGSFPVPEAPSQDLKEYDPEWGRAFWTGTVAASCDHERMLRSVKLPAVLLTHHMRAVNEENGFLLGAMTDQQAHRVRELLTSAGVEVTYRSFPEVAHSMHGTKPELYVQALLEWVGSLDGRAADR